MPFRRTDHPLWLAARPGATHQLLPHCAAFDRALPFLHGGVLLAKAVKYVRDLVGVV